MNTKPILDYLAKNNMSANALSIKADMTYRSLFDFLKGKHDLSAKNMKKLYLATGIDPKDIW